MKYNYILGGITIKSDIYYPELIQIETEGEVELKYGTVPEHLEHKTTDFPFIEANDSQYLLKLDKIGKYLIENESSIIIEAFNDSTKRDLEKFVLTNIFGAISFIRGLIPMHGGVVIKNGKTFLISGVSGKGKSSRLVSLLKKGYTLLTDDISNIKIENGIPYVYPSFPYLLLWKDTIEKHELSDDNIYRLLSENDKYFFPIPEHQFHAEKIELNNMIILFSGTDDDKIEITGLKKIEALKANTFKPWMIQAFHKQAHVFGELIKMGNNINLVLFDNNSHKSHDENTDSLIARMEELC